jgi:hypothetical protein
LTMDGLANSVILRPQPKNLAGQKRPLEYAEDGLGLFPFARFLALRPTIVGLRLRMTR